MQRPIYLLHLLFTLLVLSAPAKAGTFSNIPPFNLEINVSDSYQLSQSVYQNNQVLYASSPAEKEDSLHIKQMRRKGKWSKFLGIGSIGCFLTALVCITVLPLALVLTGASIAASIGAIVTGNQVKNHTNDPKALADARFGLIAGTVGIITIVSTIVAIILIIALIAALFASILGSFLSGIR